MRHLIDPDAYGIYGLAGANPEETARAVRISALGSVPDGPITFRPDPRADYAAAWQRWAEGPLRAALAPHLAKSLALAARGHHRELAAADLRLGDRLSFAAAEGSRAAGARLIAEGEGALYLYEVSRLKEAAAAGAAAGHFATVFAARAAAFHIAQIPACIAYLHAEWRAATPLEYRYWHRFAPLCEAALPAALDALGQHTETFTLQAASA
ncbi:MAG: hypothetical protein R3F11_29965 [Verrucomicrobiales bacterium]